MVLPVLRRIHWGIGRFCFWALASFCLVRKDFWLYWFTNSTHTLAPSFSMIFERRQKGNINSRVVVGVFVSVSSRVFHVPASWWLVVSFEILNLSQGDGVKSIIGFSSRAKFRCVRFRLGCHVRNWCEESWRWCLDASTFFRSLQSWGCQEIMTPLLCNHKI